MSKFKCFLLSLLLLGCSSAEKKAPQESQSINSQDSQQVQAQETSQIPPVSRIEWEMCNTTGSLRTPCTEPLAISYHWGEVKEIKIFKVKGLGDNEFVQAFVKSQGCFEDYDKPQPQHWYPISGTANEIKGKKAEARIITSTVLDQKTREALAALRSPSSFIGVGEQCTARAEKDS